MKLTHEQVRGRLGQIPGWEYDGTDIARTVRCRSFPDAIELVRAAAEEAEKANHHPDIDIRYDTVRFAVHTHSEQGITDKDFQLAGAINTRALSYSA